MMSTILKTDSFSFTVEQSAKEQAARSSDLHIHSTFSDGKNTPEEIVERAVLKGYREIAVVDHVRRDSDWLDLFSAEIERLKKVYSGKIKLYSGIEAKVINLEGDIDARPEFFSEVDLVLSAFHRIPKGQDEFFSDEEIARYPDKALECWFKGKSKLLENPDVDIIAHPTAILKRKGLPLPSNLKRLISQKAAVSHKVFEINPKYQVPDLEFLHWLQINGVKLSFGSDSHSIDEI